LVGRKGEKKIKLEVKAWLMPFAEGGEEGQDTIEPEGRLHKLRGRDQSLRGGITVRGGTLREKKAGRGEKEAISKSPEEKKGQVRD